MPNTSYKYSLEIACFNLESCVIAQDAGADRIELCQQYALGGLTPTYDDIIKARALIKIPLHVIIRPHAHGFVYSSQEIIQMQKDILFCKQQQIDGVVFGALNANHHVDIDKNKALLSVCDKMSSTFHRAVDGCHQIPQAIESLISLGFQKVLTSGGKQTALEGKEQIKMLQQQFGKYIQIMPGGSIRSNHIKELQEATHCNEFHSAALLDNPTLTNEQEVTQLKQQLLSHA